MGCRAEGERSRCSKYFEVFEVFCAVDLAQLCLFSIVLQKDRSPSVRGFELVRIPRTHRGVKKAHSKLCGSIEIHQIWPGLPASPKVIGMSVCRMHV